MDTKMQKVINHEELKKAFTSTTQRLSFLSNPSQTLKKHGKKGAWVTQSSNFLQLRS